MPGVDHPTESVGTLLRLWRHRRRLTQLDLSLAAEVSTRHLSFVETGRSRPTDAMILHLCTHLDVPLRDRNTLLLAAGYAPAYPGHELTEPAMAPIGAVIDGLLAAHEPFPAVVVDRHWNLVAANDAVSLLTAGATADLLEPPVNVLRLSLHPDGMAPRIINLGEWRAHLLERLARQITSTADAELVALLHELKGYPGPSDGARDTGSLVVPLRYRSPAGDLRLLSTTTVFGTPRDVMVSELAIETFYPADPATGDVLRSREATTTAAT